MITNSRVRLMVPATVLSSYTDRYYTQHDKHSTHVYLTYDRRRPFEICMNICASPSPFGRPHERDYVTWTFARQLVLDALSMSIDDVSGVGDVIMWRDDDMFYVRLASDDGECTLRFSLDDVRVYAHESLVLVPHGQEDVSADIECVLSQLFDVE